MGVPLRVGCASVTRPLRALLDPVRRTAPALTTPTDRRGRLVVARNSHVCRAPAVSVRHGARLGCRVRYRTHARSSTDPKSLIVHRSQPTPNQTPSCIRPPLARIRRGHYHRVPPALHALIRPTGANQTPSLQTERCDNQIVRRGCVLTGLEDPARPRIAPKNTQVLAVRRGFVDRLGEPGIVAMPLGIDEKRVLPVLHPARTLVDVRQVHTR